MFLIDSYQIISLALGLIVIFDQLPSTVHMTNSLPIKLFSIFPLHTGCGQLVLHVLTFTYIALIRSKTKDHLDGFAENVPCIFSLSSDSVMK